MTLTARRFCGIVCIILFSLPPILQNIAVADENPLPFSLKKFLPLQRIVKQEHSPHSNHIVSEKSEYPPRGIVSPARQDFHGMLTPAKPAASLDPSKAPSQYTTSAIVSYNYGVSLFNQGKVVQASEEWKAAGRVQPTFPEVQYALSLLSHLQGHEEDAMSYAIKAQLLKSDWATAAYHLGVLHYQAGQLALAGQEFQRALQLEPNNPMAMNGVGLSKLREGQLQDAAQALALAITGNPNLPSLHHNLGLTLFAHQHWEPARRQFKETLRLNPTLDSTHYWLGMTHAAMGQWSQAISSWLRAIAWNPHHSQLPRVYYNLGTAYWMTGNPMDAKQAFRMALRDHSIGPQAHYQMGVIDMSLSQWDKASQHFLTSSQLEPDWEQPYFNLGLVRYNQGLVRDALEAFQQAVALHPDFTDAQFHLGLTLRILHQDQGAFIALEKAAQAGHIAAQEMLAGMYANGRGTTRNLQQAMQWWHRASRGHQGDQAADHARAQLSRLRQIYFLHHDNHAYTQELRDGFHAIQKDIWHDFMHVSRNTIHVSDHTTSIGMALASTGQILQAIPLLLNEAYSLHSEAHRYLQLLIKEGMLSNSPAQLTQVMNYFSQTASEGSSDSCRFLALLPSPSEMTHRLFQQTHLQSALCRPSIP